MSAHERHPVETRPIGPESGAAPVAGQQRGNGSGSDQTEQRSPAHDQTSVGLPRRGVVPGSPAAAALRTLEGEQAAPVAPTEDGRQSTDGGAPSGQSAGSGPQTEFAGASGEQVPVAVDVADGPRPDHDQDSRGDRVAAQPAKAFPTATADQREAQEDPGTAYPPGHLADDVSYPGGDYLDEQPESPTGQRGRPAHQDTLAEEEQDGHAAQATVLETGVHPAVTDRPDRPAEPLDESVTLFNTERDDKEGPQAAGLEVEDVPVSEAVPPQDRPVSSDAPRSTNEEILTIPGSSPATEVFGVDGKSPLTHAAPEDVVVAEIVTTLAEKVEEFTKIFQGFAGHRDALIMYLQFLSIREDLRPPDLEQMVENIFRDNDWEGNLGPDEYSAVLKKLESDKATEEAENGGPSEQRLFVAGADGSDGAEVYSLVKELEGFEETEQQRIAREFVQELRDQPEVRMELTQLLLPVLKVPDKAPDKFPGIIMQIQHMLEELGWPTDMDNPLEIYRDIFDALAEFNLEEQWEKDGHRVGGSDEDPAISGNMTPAIAAPGHDNATREEMDRFFGRHNDATGDGNSNTPEPLPRVGMTRREAAWLRLQFWGLKPFHPIIARQLEENRELMVLEKQIMTQEVYRAYNAHKGELEKTDGALDDEESRGKPARRHRHLGMRKLMPSSASLLAAGYLINRFTQTLAFGGVSGKLHVVDTLDAAGYAAGGLGAFLYTAGRVEYSARRDYDNTVAAMEKSNNAPAKILQIENRKAARTSSRASRRAATTESIMNRHFSGESHEEPVVVVLQKEGPDQKSTE